jgi:hypothetical protein
MLAKKMAPELMGPFLRHIFSLVMNRFMDRMNVVPYFVIEGV